MIYAEPFTSGSRRLTADDRGELLALTGMRFYNLHKLTWFARAYYTPVGSTILGPEEFSNLLAERIPPKPRRVPLQSKPHPRMTRVPLASQASTSHARTQFVGRPGRRCPFCDGPYQTGHLLVCRFVS